MTDRKDKDRPVAGEVSGDVTGTVTGTVTPEDDAASSGRRASSTSPGYEDGFNREGTEAQQAGQRARPDGSAYEDGYDDSDAARDEQARAEAENSGEPVPVDEHGLPLTQEERDELARPVAAVPAGVSLDDIEPADGFRLPRDQNEAEQARQLAQRDAEDASRPEVAQRLADDAKARAEAAQEEADTLQSRADEAKDRYDGPGRPALDEGWRYVKPEPDVHDPA
jgi:hypothetical protein